VPGGVGLDHLAAVLPDRAGPDGAAPDDVDEADDPVRVCGGGGCERGSVGEGGRGEAAAHGTELAETAATEAERLLANAKRALRRARTKAAELKASGEHDPAAGRRRGRLVRAVEDLTELLDAVRKIAAQTRQRLAGTTPAGATRRVSLHDPDARPIAKGRLGKPVEFGYKAQVADNDGGVVLDHTVELGNPADASQLKPAVERVIKRTGRQPRTVTADRGYGEQGVDDA
jgi:transposase, IS5 family